MIAQIDQQFLRTRPHKAWSRLLAYTFFEGRPLTTRGQWINPAVFAILKTSMHLPIRPLKHDPIFIYGVGRSGTTALGRVLSLHKDVGYLNEPKAIWQAAFEDDDLIGSYSLVPGRYRKSSLDFNAEATLRLKRAYAAYATLSGTSRVVDKYPELLFRDGLVERMFPNARKILLIRDGADLCCSIEKWSLKHGHSEPFGSEDWWGRNRRKWHLLLSNVLTNDPAFKQLLPIICTFRRQVDMAAVEWIASMREAIRLIEASPPNLTVLKYEDLIADPVRQISRIKTTCRLRHDPKVLSYARTTLMRKTVHGYPDLHPSIQPLFVDTLENLGYTLPRPHAHLANIA